MSAPTMSPDDAVAAYYADGEIAAVIERLFRNLREAVRPGAKGVVAAREGEAIAAEFRRRVSDHADELADFAGPSTRLERVHDKPEWLVALPKMRHALKLATGNRGPRLKSYADALAALRTIESSDELIGRWVAAA